MKIRICSDLHIDVNKTKEFGFDKKLDEVDAFIFNNANNNTNNNDNKHKKMWITSAHRGLVDGVLHENTLGAFYNAYLNGADIIETDARLTADGILIANHNLLEITSLKINNAIIDVATISKLFNNETLAEFVLVIPSINKIGAIMSKTTIAIV